LQETFCKVDTEVEAVTQNFQEEEIGSISEAAL